MYLKYDLDDDTDTIMTRGKELESTLRAAEALIPRVEDPAARDAIRHLIHAMHLASDVLWEVSNSRRLRF